MSEDFDIGPLSWVKDQIDQSLNVVLESLSTVATNPADVASMRFAQTHLYQVSGALDMVGLEGCKLFTHQLEKLAGNIEKQSVAASEDVVADFQKAVQTLKNYLQNIMGGGGDIPLRLLDTLKPIVELNGEVLEPTELFFPDTTNPLPKSLPSRLIEPSEQIGFLTEQRALYQKSLLSWLTKQDNTALGNMALAVGEVAQVQKKNADKTLWWVANAFVHSLSEQKISAQSYAKKVCRKIDQELKSFSENILKPHNQLVREMLYFVAISNHQAEIVKTVKDVYELESLLPDDSADTALIKEVDERELDVVFQLKFGIIDLKDIWHQLSQHAADSAASSCSDLTIQFLATTQKAIKTSQLLSVDSFTKVFTGLENLAQALNTEKLAFGDHAFIEGAAVLNITENELENYQSLNSTKLNKLEAMASRLDAIASGEDVMAADSVNNELDIDVVKAVAAQIKEALKQIEQILDGFFRNPEDKTKLNGTAKYIQQSAAAFEMLSLQTPKQMIDAFEQLIQHFQQDDYQSNEKQFELVADTVSILSFYLDEMPKPRAESEATMVSGLELLHEELAQFNTIESSAAGLSSNVLETSIESTQIAEVAIDEEKLAFENRLVLAATDPNAVTEQANDEEFLQIYLSEAEEVLASNAQQLQTLKIKNTDHDALVDLRRGFHTLKGSGRMVGLNALGNTAGFVEKMLNGVLDKKALLTPAQHTTVEQMNAVFAAWVAELAATKQVTINPEQWEARIVKSASGVKVVEEPPAPILKTEVASEVHKVVAKPIVETINKPVSKQPKVSPALYEVFLNETQQNLLILQQDADNIKLQDNQITRTIAIGAVHTMASNSLTAGFAAMGELGRTIETWLDSFRGEWDKQNVDLYQQSVDTLATMYGKATQNKTPRAAPKLLQQLRTEIQLYKSIQTEPLDLDQIYFGEQTKSLDANAFAKPSHDDLNDAHVEMHVIDSDLLEIFAEEAKELIPVIGSSLRAWRTEPELSQHPDTLQRVLHTLKGSARMAGQVALGDSVHTLEDYVIKALKQEASQRDYEHMFEELDHISNLFEPDSHSTTVETTEDIGQATEKTYVARKQDRNAQYLRLRADTLDRLINEAGEISITRSRLDREMQGFKQSSQDLTESIVRLRAYLRELELEADTQLQSRMSLMQEAHEAFDPLEFDRFTRLQELTRMMAESVNDVSTIQNGLLTNLGQTEAALQQQSRMNRDLQQGLMGVRMLPFSQIAERMQRIVRQTARELKKRVDLQIDGESTEIDRSLLEKIGAPLEHLLRNAVAHGIELPMARKKAGKSEIGKLLLKVSQNNDEISIVLSDDGAGIDLVKVKQKAIAQKLISEKAEPSEQNLMEFLFEAGFSTATTVTQISGRGVGLDVVRNEVAGLGGRIDVANAMSKGATFSIHLPVSQSVAQVLMVQSQNTMYALPVTMIEQAQKIKTADLIIANNQGYVTWSNTNYHLHHINQLLDHDAEVVAGQSLSSVLLLKSGAYQIALQVDEILGNQEVVMKPIGPQVARVPGMMGATVLGDGQIVMIINPIQLANRESLSAGTVQAKSAKFDVIKKRTALVVDDSLTMRKVLGRLLEREGFEVLVAKDGMDAIQVLQQTVPNIILTDIEMPRMDGFGLARNIRDDYRTATVPLIMISSRTADKHQNLAKQLGVDAFFGKPVQEDELMAAVNQLLAAKQALH